MAKIAIDSGDFERVFKDLLHLIDAINALPSVAEVLNCLDFEPYEDRELNQQGRKFVVACFKELLSCQTTEIELSLADIRDRLLVIRRVSR